MLKKQRGGGPRRYRYGGSGILDGLIHKLFSSSVKSVINRGVNSVVAHKLANTVVNGATTAAKKTANAALNGATQATQRAAERAVNEAINTVTPYVKKKLVGVVQKTKKKKKTKKVAGKRPAAAAITSPPAAKRLNINSLIDGSGIVLD